VVVGFVPTIFFVIENVAGVYPVNPDTSGLGKGTVVFVHS
jgi:hypothetical protein